MAARFYHWIVFGLVLSPLGALAQEAKKEEPAKADPLGVEQYLPAPKEIADAVNAPWWNNWNATSFSPGYQYALRQLRSGQPRLQDLGRPHLNLAGMDLDFGANRARSLSVRSVDGFETYLIGTEKVNKIPVPEGCRVSNPSWSPDRRHVAYFLHRPDRTELWIYTHPRRQNPPTNRLLTEVLPLPTLYPEIDWLDDTTVIAVLTPKSRMSLPNSDIAAGPRVYLSEAKKYSLRAYPSLLETPEDAAKFEYYATGQLSLIDVSGKVTPLGKPSMVSNVSPSPDGVHMMVTTVEKPFSYLYPWSSFPLRQVILDRKGKELVELRKRGLNSTSADGDGPEPGVRRDLAWRPDGQGLSYLEEGAMSNGKRPDRIMQWRAPFVKGTAKALWTTDTRIQNVRYSLDGEKMFVQQTIDGNSRLSLVKLYSYLPIKLVETKASEDPVRLVTSTTPFGATAVRVTTSGEVAFLQGTDYAADPTKAAPRPWIDRLELSTGKRNRIWQSKADVYEQATLLDDNAGSAVVVRQSRSMVPQSYLVQIDTGGERLLTANKDYAPDLTQAKRERIKITRADGNSFWATVTLPNYVLGKRPAFFWFYPREFVNQDAYDKSVKTFNINEFAQVGGANKAILIRLGYVVVEPDCPIFGPANRKNDLYGPQLRNNLAATIDALDKKGWIDRENLGLGGHSYGAFSTVNAMIQTPFFKAGIAGDGNYNRSLTPFGFQSDERTLWEARETYINVSPILFADQLNGALLMYHGQEDQNVGTAPLNSERLFAALQSQGKTAALFMYPYEDHGQITRETINDQWARWVGWLNRYLKGGK